MASNAKFSILMIKIMFFTIMSILEGLSAHLALRDNWSHARDVGIATAAFNSAQCLCKLGMAVASLVSLVHQLHQDLAGPDAADVAVPAEQGQLLPLEEVVIDAEDALTEAEDDVIDAADALTEAEDSSIVPALDTEAGLERAAGGPALAASTGQRSAVPGLPGPGLWTWRPAPAEESDGDM